METRLYRSRTDRVIAGVCGGIAEHYGWDPTLVRLAAVALGLLTQGTAVLAYIAAAILIPEAPGEGYAQGSPFTVPPYDSGFAPTAPSTPPVPGSGVPEQPVPPQGDMPQPVEPPAESVAGEAATAESAGGEAAAEPAQPYAPAEQPGAHAPVPSEQPGAYSGSEPDGTAAHDWAAQHPTAYAGYGPARPRRGGIVFGAILILLGVFLLLGYFLDWATMAALLRLWPLILIVIGLAIIFGRGRRG